jgi:hypothetical protein
MGSDEHDLYGEACMPDTPMPSQLARNRGDIG